MYCQHCGTEMVNGVCPNCDLARETKAPNVDAPNFTINNSSSVNLNDNYVYKGKWVAFFLCLFLGGLGIHRFYVGKIGTGIIWLLTAGLFGIGWLVDLICILAGAFSDKQGMGLK